MIDPRLTPIFVVRFRELATKEEFAWQTQPFEHDHETEEEAKEAALGHFSERLAGLEEGQDYICVVEKQG